MNRTGKNIPFSGKYKKWYQNPFIRILLLAAVLVVVIIICVNVLNGKNKENESANASFETMAEAESASGDGVPGSDAAYSADAKDADYAVDGGAAAANGTEADAAAQLTPAARITPAAQPQVEGVTAPAAADGTGAAGVMQMTEEMLASSTETGWHYTYKGMWYSMTPGLCYYNGWQEVDGSTYHFGAEGYRDVGWKRIGDQVCCFDNNGVYQPDASTEKMVAFTFDDGPSQGMDMLLELCEETGARVTFFMIGVQVENGGAVIPHIMQDHCQLGNHSYTHSLMLKKTPEECAADFNQCDEFIRSFSGGYGADVVRFPYGDLTEEHAKAVGKPCILWDVDSLDWESQDAEQIKERVYTLIRDGSVILMHDRYDATVEACRELFPNLIAQGYQLVTVEELSIAKGIEMQPGGVYYDFTGEETDAPFGLVSMEEAAGMAGTEESDGTESTEEPAEAEYTEVPDETGYTEETVEAEYTEQSE